MQNESPSGQISPHAEQTHALLADSTVFMVSEGEQNTQINTPGGGIEPLPGVFFVIRQELEEINMICFIYVGEGW